MPSSKKKSRAKPPLTFLGAAHAKSPKGFDAAIFGAPHGTPYKGIDNRMHEGAPDAFRKAMAEDGRWNHHYDFDHGGPLLAEGFAVADLGNLPTRSRDGGRNRKLIGEQTRAILAAGAVPIMFGGDDSVPIPFIAAFAGGPPITILQIDAHIDWREERRGEPLGYSSTMRRASEEKHVSRIVQAGMRGVGSARPAEVADALKWGASLNTSRDIHHRGVGFVVEQISKGCDCLVTLDCDSIDVAQMPAVPHPSPGGLTYTQVVDLIDGVAARARIVGFCMVEFMPKRDRHGAAAYTAGRIAANVIARLRKRA